MQMIMNHKTRLAAIVLAMASGCKVAPPPPPKVEAASSKVQPAPPGKQLTFSDISGYVVPGLAHLAKLRGYTACESSSYSLDCTHPKPPDFFGVPVVRASLSLDRGNHVGLETTTAADPRDITGATLDDLTYRAIVVEFKDEGMDFECIERSGKPSYAAPECAMPGTLDAAVNAILKEGWVEVSNWKGSRQWMHPEALASISDFKHGPDAALTVTAETPQTVKDLLAAALAEKEARERRQAEKDRLEEAMRSD